MSEASSAVVRDISQQVRKSNYFTQIENPAQVVGKCRTFRTGMIQFVEQASCELCRAFYKVKIAKKGFTRTRAQNSWQKLNALEFSIAPCH